MTLTLTTSPFEINRRQNNITNGECIDVEGIHRIEAYRLQICLSSSLLGLFTLSLYGWLDYYGRMPTSIIIVILQWVSVIQCILVRFSPTQLIENHDLEITECILKVFNVNASNILRVARLLKFPKFNFSNIYDLISEPRERLSALVVYSKSTSRPYILSPMKLGNHQDLLLWAFKFELIPINYPIAVEGFPAQISASLCGPLAEFIVFNQPHEVASVGWLQTCIKNLNGYELIDFIRTCEPILSSVVLANSNIPQFKLPQIIPVLYGPESSFLVVRLAGWASLVPEVDRFLKSYKRDIGTIKGELEGVLRSQSKVKVLFDTLGEELLRCIFDILIISSELNLDDVFSAEFLNRYVEIFRAATMTPFMARKLFQHGSRVIINFLLQKTNLILRTPAEFLPSSLLSPEGILCRWQKLMTGQLPASAARHYSVSDDEEQPDDLKLLRDSINTIQHHFSSLLSIPTNINIRVKGNIHNLADFCISYVDKALATKDWLYEEDEIPSNYKYFDRWMAFVGCWPYLLIRGHRVDIHHLFKDVRESSDACRFTDALLFQEQQYPRILPGMFTNTLSTHCWGGGLGNFSAKQFIQLVGTINE